MNKFILHPLTAYILLFFLSLAQTFIFLRYDVKISSAFVYLISTFLFYFLLSQISQVLLKIFLIFSLVVSVMVYPVLVVYGELDYNLSASFFYTNGAEARSYAQAVPTYIQKQLFLLFLFTLGLLFLKFKKIKSKIPLYAALMALLVQPLKKILTIGFNANSAEAYIDILPLKKSIFFALQLAAVNRDNNFIEDIIAKPDSWEIDNRDSIKLSQNFVIVVGESVRKDFMHSYGFPIENTPFIDSSERWQFNNYLAVGANTLASLQRTLALTTVFPSYELNNNIVTLGEFVGYSTYWLSNQGQVGAFDSPVAAIAKSSATYKFLKKGDFSGTLPDIALLPLFRNTIIKDNTSKKLIILHMVGSHPSSCGRTGGKYDEFFLSEDLSCYVQSVKNTDKFLHSVHDMLEKTKQTYTLIYLSDHGLKINDDLQMVHGNALKQSYEVPLIIWSSSIAKSEKFSARRSGKDFLHLFSELNGFSTHNFKSDYVFCSNEDSGEKKSFTLDANQKIVNYSALPGNPIPENKDHKP